MDVQNNVQEQLDGIVSLVENARALPMSASCVVNRAELVALLQALREALPAELAHAQSVMADHEQVVADAQAQADQIIRGAHEERGSLISDTEVVRRAQAEGDRILAEARAEVEAKRAEADDYVDSKLANFEVVLTKTLGAVGRGRQKLRGDSVYQPEGEGDEEEFHPPISPSPEADEYVDVKLATLEAVLSATLEAVGKGRDKLLGKKPIDELAEYLAAADQAQQRKDQAEAGHAGFAEDGEEPWYRADVPQQQNWPEQSPAAAGWQAPGEEQYGNQYQGQAEQYGEVYGGGYDPAGTPQTDPYGNPYGYQQASYATPHYQAQHDQWGHPQQEAGGGYPQGYPAAQQPQHFDAWGNPGPEAGGGYQQHPQVPQQAGLDETSFFDTSMIDMTRLRELGGR